MRWFVFFAPVILRSAIFVLLLYFPAAGFGQDLMCPQVVFGEDGDTSAPPDDRLVLTADQAEITQEGLSTLAGTVRLIQGGNRFEAQALSYDEKAQVARVQAESLFRNRSLIIKSRQAEFDLLNETGVFLGTEFTLVDRAARGGAEAIRLSKAGTVNIDDVYYTTCAPGSRAWFLQASKIKLDREKGVGTARHARLRFGYVPILYTPWFQFPIDNRRTSGFLFPTLGRSDNTGIDLSIPYYLNLAPNYDAQITPRYMSDRGTQLITDGRYLFPSHTGHLAYEYLDNDRVQEDLGLGSRRSYLKFDHAGLLNRRLALDARYGKVSDDRYFEDLGGALDASAVTHLEQSATLTYAAPAAYTITAGVAEYQTVTRNVLPTNEPYQRLPQIRVDALTRKSILNTRLGFSGEYVNFARNVDVPLEPRQGQRMDLDPFLRFQLDQSAWYLGSQIDWRYTQYKVADPGSSVAATDPSRKLPVTSLEGGLRFERVTKAGQLQTLEPKLYYLYVPYDDQSDLPRFDVGEPDFDFVQLFARNRFSGEDRISDANHAAAAFTSRLIDPDNGLQRFSFSVGQIYRFQAPRVGVNETGLAPPPDDAGTDYIAEFDYRPLGNLALRSTAQWSPDRNEFVRSSVGARYRKDRLLADLSYRYRATLSSVPGNELEQTDVSLASPIAGGWSALARWRHSLADDRTLEALGGLEYNTCCWAVRTAYRRYQFSFDIEPKYANSFYLQLELKGLSRIGAGFQSLIPAMN